VFSWMYTLSCVLCLLQYVCKQRTTGGGCMSWLSVRVLGSDRTAGFSEHEARFFIACALLGVEAMHKQGIIHRCDGWDVSTLPGRCRDHKRCSRLVSHTSN
jgi:hypothetical protein